MREWTARPPDTYHIDEVERLAEEIPEGVGVVQVHRLDEVLDEARLAAFALFLGADQSAPHPVGDHADLVVLQHLPDPVGHVEDDALEEEDERDPLVVAVVALLLVVVAEAGVSHVAADVLALLVGQGEGVRDPAVGVNHVARDTAVVYALDGVACKGLRLAGAAPSTGHLPIKLFAVTMMQQTKSMAEVTR